MIYFLAFTISITLCWIGEKAEIQLSKKISYIFWVTSVLILVVLAGCRDYTVGTDIRFYGNLIFNGAVSYDSLTRFLRDFGWRAEPLYLILNYFISRFTNSAHWIYASIGSIIYSSFFVGLYRFRKKISLTYGWTIFILLFFSSSFNLMRQMLAMSMIFMGSIHLLDSKYLRFLPYVILGALFHQTSIVFSFLALLVHFFIPRYHRGFYQLLIVLGAIVLIFSYRYLLEWLINVGILAAKYRHYVFEYHYDIISINPFIQRVFPIILFYCFSRIRCNDDKDMSTFLFAMMLLDFVLVLMGGIGDASLQRVSFYCSCYNIWAYPFFLRRIKSKNNRIVIGLLILLSLFGIWIYQIVYRGSSEIWPYTSELLGIR